MEPENVVIALQVSAAAVFVIIAYRFAYVPASVSLFRQHLFALRRALFLMAADEQISFTDPAYTRIRTTLNSCLRFADRLTLYRTMLPFFFTRRADLDVIWGDGGRTEDLIARVSKRETRVGLEWIRVQLGEAIVQHMLRTSPIGCVVMILTSSFARRSRPPLASQMENSAEALALVEGAQPAA